MFTLLLNGIMFLGLNSSLPFSFGSSCFKLSSSFASFCLLFSWLILIVDLLSSSSFFSSFSFSSPSFSSPSFFSFLSPFFFSFLSPPFFSFFFLRILFFFFRFYLYTKLLLNFLEPFFYLIICSKNKNKAWIFFLFKIFSYNQFF